MNRPTMTIPGCMILLAGCGESRRTETRPPGAETTARTDVLKTGAAALRTSAPLSRYGCVTWSDSIR